LRNLYVPVEYETKTFLILDSSTQYALNLTHCLFKILAQIYNIIAKVSSRLAGKSDSNSRISNNLSFINYTSKYEIYEALRFHEKWTFGIMSHSSHAIFNRKISWTERRYTKSSDSRPLVLGYNYYVCLAIYTSCKLLCSETLVLSLPFGLHRALNLTIICLLMIDKFQNLSHLNPTTLTRKMCS
jgi:hypothetical protein